MACFTPFFSSFLAADNGIVTFPDGNTVTWNIESDGNWQPTYSSVGTAKNNFETWNVYKDNYRVLYEVDGWKCYTLYWCF